MIIELKPSWFCGIEQRVTVAATHFRQQISQAVILIVAVYLFIWTTLAVLDVALFVTGADVQHKSTGSIALFRVG